MPRGIERNDGPENVADLVSGNRFPVIARGDRRVDVSGGRSAVVSGVVSLGSWTQ